jgi:hypothetical protein
MNLPARRLCLVTTLIPLFLPSIGRMEIPQMSNIEVLDDQIDSVLTYDCDVAQAVDSHSPEIHLNVHIMTGILEDQQVLGHMFAGVDLGGSPVSVTTLLHQVIETCCARF